MRITYVQLDGQETTVEVPAGVSVMRAAVTHDIRGIIAECGGSCMCATCHVYVESGDLPAFSPRSDDEDDMLDVAAAPRQDNSRLSCQLVSTSADAQLRVIVPAEQV